MPYPLGDSPIIMKGATSQLLYRLMKSTADLSSANRHYYIRKKFNFTGLGETRENL